MKKPVGGIAPAPGARACGLRVFAPGSLLPWQAALLACALASPARGSGGAASAGPEADACAGLREELPGRRVGGVVIEAVTSCGRAVEPAPFVSSSPSSPLAPERVAAVPLYLDVKDGPPSHGAILVAFAQGRWRLADFVLDPAWTHGGHCSSRFSLRWSGAGAARSLRVTAERICHQPLDQDELAAGVSSVASTECRTLDYRIGQKALERVAARQVERACAFK